MCVKGRGRLSLEGSKVLLHIWKYRVGLIKVSREGRVKAQVHKGVNLKYFSFRKDSFSLKSMK